MEPSPRRISARRERDLRTRSEASEKVVEEGKRGERNDEDKQEIGTAAGRFGIEEPISAMGTMIGELVDGGGTGGAGARGVVVGGEGLLIGGLFVAQVVMCFTNLHRRGTPG